MYLKVALNWNTWANQTVVIYIPSVAVLSLENKIFILKTNDYWFQISGIVLSRTFICVASFPDAKSQSTLHEWFKSNHVISISPEKAKSADNTTPQHIVL